MKAIGSKILVKEVEQEVLQEKIGNLTVPVGNDKEKMLCEVLSVGEEVKGLKPGDKIYNLEKTEKIIELFQYQIF